MAIAEVVPGHHHRREGEVAESVATRPHVVVGTQADAVEKRTGLAADLGVEAVRLRVDRLPRASLVEGVAQRIGLKVVMAAVAHRELGLRKPMAVDHLADQCPLPVVELHPVVEPRWAALRGAGLLPVVEVAAHEIQRQGVAPAELLGKVEVERRHHALRTVGQLTGPLLGSGVLGQDDAFGGIHLFVVRLDQGPDLQVVVPLAADRTAELVERLGHTPQVEKGLVDRVNLDAGNQRAECCHHTTRQISVQSKVCRKHSHLTALYQRTNLIKRLSHADAEGLGLVRSGDDVMVSREITLPTATSEPCVRLSPHTAPRCIPLPRAS